MCVCVGGYLPSMNTVEEEGTSSTWGDVLFQRRPPVAVPVTSKFSHRFCGDGHGSQPGPVTG